MGQTPEESPRHRAERLCWEVARRDDARGARRLDRQPLVEGVYRLDEGAWRDDFWHFLQTLGMRERREEAHGAALHREMVPVVQSVLL
jgi:hypothetical protein